MNRCANPQPFIVPTPGAAVLHKYKYTYCTKSSDRALNLACRPSLPPDGGFITLAPT